MKKTAVIYKTKYGSTKKYAEWIAQNLSCDIFDAREVKVNDLLKYDVIIFGGGLYASGIIGIQTITKNYSKLKDKEIIIFTCGITNPEDKEQFELV
ncbi:MAG TPA: flavodoxin domain-containing protein, partial [Bacilli bacterium]